VTSLRAWVRRRAGRSGLHGHEHISRQRRIALWMTIFSAVRTLAWIVCMLIIAAHWIGVGGPFIHSFTALSGSVVFVTFISFYCNAATDAANLMAGIAALFSADSHHDAEAARVALGADFGELEADIARLADLQPGPDARALAAQIRRKLERNPAGGA
jgi:hypothetical protein